MTHQRLVEEMLNSTISMRVIINADVVTMQVLLLYKVQQHRLVTGLGEAPQAPPPPPPPQERAKRTTMNLDSLIEKMSR